MGWRDQSMAAKWMDVYGVLALVCIVTALTLGVDEWPLLARCFGAGFGFSAGAAALLYLRQRGRGWWHGVWTFWSGFWAWGMLGQSKERASEPSTPVSNAECWSLFCVVLVLSIGYGLVVAHLG